MCKLVVRSRERGWTIKIKSVESKLGSEEKLFG